jgi:hypothetical protein
MGTIVDHGDSATASQRWGHIGRSTTRHRNAGDARADQATGECGSSYQWVSDVTITIEGEGKRSRSRRSHCGIAIPGPRHCHSTRICAVNRHRTGAGVGRSHHLAIVGNVDRSCSGLSRRDMGTIVDHGNEAAAGYY